MGARRLSRRWPRRSPRMVTDVLLSLGRRLRRRSAGPAARGSVAGRSRPGASVAAGLCPRVPGPHSNRALQGLAAVPGLWPRRYGSPGHGPGASTRLSTLCPPCGGWSDEGQAAGATGTARKAAKGRSPGQAVGSVAVSVLAIGVRWLATASFRRRAAARQTQPGAAARGTAMGQGLGRAVSYSVVKEQKGQPERCCVLLSTRAVRTLGSFRRSPATDHDGIHRFRRCSQMYAESHG
jgi:hypothetical protein